MSLGQALAPIVDFVYPPRCPLCGGGLLSQNGLCLACWSKLEVPSAAACSTCLIPLEKTGAAEANQCETCLKHPPLHDGVYAGTIYNDISRELVLSFKHGGKIALAPLMARLIASRLPANASDFVLVPVPLHPWRLWRRGFNQSALLARELSKITGAMLIVDGLKRIKPTASLAGLGARERKAALKGVIEIRAKHAKSIRGANIVLIDDVLTSGATSSACTEQLKANGARRVQLACFAKTQEHERGVL